METLLNTRTAVLQALLDGPAHGLEITRRVLARTAGGVRLSHSNVYAALAALKRARLVRSWTDVPRGRRGARGRIRYDLTAVGVEQAVAQRAMLRALLTPPRIPEPSAEEKELMVMRMRRCAALSASVMRLRRAMPGRA